jgi:tetratricopeptide (TPR) repeat protein
MRQEAPGTRPARERGAALQANAILGRRHRGLPPGVLALALILIGGMLLRAAYLSERVQAPDFRVPLKDAAFHDYWARALVSGDWTPPPGEPDPRIREVPFTRPPGYPYFLAGLYALTGGSYAGAIAGQMLLGLVNVLLAYRLGRALLGRAPALVLAAFCAGYWALIYFEGELLPPVLIITLMLLVLLLLHDWQMRPRWRTAGAAGALLGLSSLVRPNGLALVPVAAVWMAALAWRRGLRRIAWTHAAVLLLALAFAIAPATLRNAIVAWDFVPISVNGGINLYIGNNPAADGTTATLPELEELTGTGRWNWFAYDRIVQGLSREAGRPLRYSQASAIFARRAREFVRRQPARFLRLCLRRAALMWGPAEVSNNKTDQLEREHSRALRWNGNFAFVLASGLLGAVLLGSDARARRARAASGSQAAAEKRATSGPGAGPEVQTASLILVALFAFAYAASFVPFLAAARFRAPLPPLIFLFGAYGLHRTFLFARARCWKRLAIVIALGAGLYALSSLPLAAYEVNPASWHRDRATALALGGRIEEAVAECRQALAIHPGYVDARATLARLLAGSGRPREALEQYAELIRYRPEREDFRLGRAALLLTTGEIDAAMPELRRISAEHPDLAEAHYQLGRALALSGDHPAAQAALRRSLELEPRQYPAWIYLGIAQANGGDYAAAVESYRRAVAIQPDSREAHCNLAMALAEVGAAREAEAAYRRALEIDPGYALALAGLGGFLAQQGRDDEALAYMQRALSAAPDDPEIRRRCAPALARPGRRTEPRRD